MFNVAIKEKEDDKEKIFRNTSCKTFYSRISHFVSLYLHFT